MHRSKWYALVSLALALGMGVVFATPASAAPTTGWWSFDEGYGANTAKDSSGSGLHGRIGSDIQAGIPLSGTEAFRFPTWASSAAGHEVIVPEDDRLDPGRSDFAVSMRLRTARDYSNVVQKGQSKTVGGYWKVEVVHGEARCVFLTSSGSGLAVGSVSRIDDGDWHTIRCGRSGATVSMYVDGARAQVRTGISGTIANDWELVVGGKSRCDGVRVGCDFFAGDIDYVRVQKG